MERDWQTLPKLDSGKQRWAGFRQKFERLLLAGTKHARQHFQTPKIALTNRLCVYFTGLMLLYVAPTAIEGDWISLVFALGSISIFISIVSLNYLGKHVLARFCFVTSSAVVVTFAIAQYAYPPAYAIQPEARLLQFVSLALPFLVFDIRERPIIWFGMAVVLIPYFFTETVSSWMGHPDLIYPYKRQWVLSATNWAVGIIALFSAFFYLQKIFVNTEEKGRRVLMHLQQQNKKLLVSQTQLQEQNQEISASQEELQVLSEQLTLQNQELQASQSELTAALESIKKKKAHEQERIRLLTIARWRNDDNLGTWADRVLAFILPQFRGLQGALYLIVEPKATEPGARPQQMQLLGVYGIGEETPAFIEVGDGLLGHLAMFRQPFKVESSSRLRGAIGGSTVRILPDSLYIMPLARADEPVGLLEITTARPLSESEYQDLERLCADVADGLAALQGQIRMGRLLEETNDKTQALETREWQNFTALAQSEQVRQQLQSALQALKRTNQELEDDLQNLKSRLENADAQHQMLENKLNLSEKMAVLGTLSAGIAHEINGPLGAIKASSATMGECLQRFLHLAPALMQSMHAVRLPLLLALWQQVSKGGANLGTRGIRQLTQRLAETLGKQNLPQAEEIARQLAEVGLKADLEPFLPLFQDEQGAQVAEATYWLGVAVNNAQNIGLATQQSQKVVEALRHFSFMQGNTNRTSINVNTQLETILILNYGAFKHGVELVRHLDPNLPDIMGHPDDLNQVWMSLVQNALNAMEGQGTLTIQTLAQPENIVVLVTDNSPGIPLHVQQRVFEPFFTGHPYGRQGGIGLHASRKIVTNHGGSLSLMSTPGNTTFRVVLPVEQPSGKTTPAA